MTAHGLMAPRAVSWKANGRADGRMLQLAARRAIVLAIVEALILQLLPRGVAAFLLTATLAALLGLSIRARRSWPYMRLAAAVKLDMSQEWRAAGMEGRPPRRSRELARFADRSDADPVMRAAALVALRRLDEAELIVRTLSEADPVERARRRALEWRIGAARGDAPPVGPVLELIRDNPDEGQRDRQLARFVLAAMVECDEVPEEVARLAATIRPPLDRRHRRLLWYGRLFPFWWFLIPFAITLALSLAGQAL